MEFNDPLGLFGECDSGENQIHEVNNTPKNNTNSSTNIDKNDSNQDIKFDISINNESEDENIDRISHINNGIYNKVTIDVNKSKINENEVKEVPRGFEEMEEVVIK